MTATDEEILKRQVWNLLQTIYEEGVGGATLGDVFSIGNDTLELNLDKKKGVSRK